ncbi:MAG TPA: hypothetical protein VFJ82_04275 [Longimicrobium sp.]|nr:hypothetical protein [Longimicrobium sp.]
MSDTAVAQSHSAPDNIVPEHSIILPAGTQVVGNATAGLITRIFTGQLRANQTSTNTIYTLPGWTSSYVNLLVLAADVNSDTNSLYWSASYAWYRQWDRPPQPHLLQQNFNWGQGNYTAASVASGNDIQVQLTQLGFDTVTRFQIVAQYMLNYPS